MSTHFVLLARSVNGALPASESRATTSVDGSTPTTCPAIPRMFIGAAGGIFWLGLGFGGGVVCASTGSGPTGAWLPPAQAARPTRRKRRDI